MAINESEIDKLAALSRVKVGQEDKRELLKDMESILGYVSEIQKISGEELLKDANAVPRNRFREDGETHESGAHTENLLKAAPEREGNYLKVKKIL